MATVLPAGVSEDSVERAFEALRGALGDHAVLTASEELREFRDPYDYQGSDEYTGSAVVMPGSTDEVRAVVRIANEHRVPLWTFGQGRNYAYGGPAPRVRGSILLNLRRMNRVLEIDDELAYAVVEPGVRFFDLHDALRGHKLWPSIPDLGWGSVIGNTLEYGRGYTPYGDHPSTACGMEVVLPDGDLLRTGMGGLTDSRSWHAYQWSFGPNHTGLFHQSNLGIVTKMGVWLMPEPELYLSCWATFDDDESVEPLIDAVRGLMLEGTVRNLPLLGRGLSVGEGAHEMFEGGWGLRFALYGREAIVEAQYELVRETLARIPGVEVGRRAYRGDERLAATDHNDKVQGGIPGLELLEAFKEPYGEETGHLDLSPVGPAIGRDVVESIAQLRKLYEAHGFPYLAGILILHRSVLHISTLFFDTKDEEQTRSAYATYGSLVVELAKAGYPIYRTNIQHMDLVAEQFDFNDHAQRRLNERLKDLLDPNGILSPGKQGIWPAAMRNGSG
jgi:4-cresol dehydrogenase (hydroxylating)